MADTLGQTARGATIAEIPASKAYYVCIHNEVPTAGIPAEILGVVVYTPPGFPPRPGFHIRYPDGSEGYAVIHDVDSMGQGELFRILSEEQIRAGEMPPLIGG